MVHYREEFKSEKNPFGYVLLIAVGGIILLALPTFISIGMLTWMYELGVVIFFSAVVYKIIRQTAYSYMYEIKDGEILIGLKVGIKETLLVEIEPGDLIAVETDVSKKTLKQKYGVSRITRCNGELTGTNGSVLVMNDIDHFGKCGVVVMPSKKFINTVREEILHENLQQVSPNQ